MDRNGGAPSEPDDTGDWGEQLAQALAAAMVTQRKTVRSLSHTSGVSRATISTYLRGERGARRPNRSSLVKLAHALKLDYDAFLAIVGLDPRSDYQPVVEMDERIRAYGETLAGLPASSRRLVLEMAVALSRRQGPRAAVPDLVMGELAERAAAYDGSVPAEAEQRAGGSGSSGTRAPSGLAAATSPGPGGPNESVQQQAAAETEPAPNL